jgi:hypothetical protein
MPLKATQRYPVSVYKFVHAARTKSGPDSIHHSNTGVDVTDELSFALTCVSAFLEKDDLRLLQHRSNLIRSLITA